MGDIDFMLSFIAVVAETVKADGPKNDRKGSLVCKGIYKVQVRS